MSHGTTSTPTSKPTRPSRLPGLLEKTQKPIRPLGRLDPNKTTDNGGTWGTITLSASDGYVRDGITHVDVLVEDDESGNETGLTALIFHEDGEPEGQPWIVGAIPEYPCLVGAETIRQQLLGE